MASGIVPVFENSTRYKTVQLPVVSKPTGGGQVSFDLPRAGIVASLWLNISLTIAGSLSAPNALGICSAIRRIQVKLNSGHNLVDISGAGYFYLLRNMLEDNKLRQSYSEALLAVTTGTKTLDITLPIALNMRDQTGLIMLQNEGTLATVILDFEADAAVATGATVTATVRPLVNVFEVPSDRKAWPDFDNIHQLVEEQIAVPASGDYDHQIPRGATLSGLYYLFPPGYTNIQLIAQQSNVIENETAELQRMRFDMTNGYDPTLAGTALTGFNKRAFFDFSGSDGLGQYGTVRDLINTQKLTSLVSRITAVGSGTLYAMRRQIVSLGR